MTAKRSVTPHHRLGTHGYKPGVGGHSIHAREVHCTDCTWSGLRIDASDPCGHCGGSIAVGTRAAARSARGQRCKPAAIVGTRCPIEEAETDRRLREARESAQR